MAGARGGGPRCEPRLAQLARRLKRAEARDRGGGRSRGRTATVDIVAARRRLRIEASRFADLPAEIALRLLGRAMAGAGDEGPVELGKLEALKCAALAAQTAAKARFRRTLGRRRCDADRRVELIVERAPPRRAASLNQAATRAAQAMRKTR